MSLRTTTHEVFNQTPELRGHNRYAGNLPLREGVAREGAGWADAWLVERGLELGSEQMQEWAIQANRNPPQLQAFSATGERSDTVLYHPAYHALMGYLKRHGVSSGPWADPKPGAHVARAALFQLFAEVEGGALCPTTMTYACVPALKREPKLAATWLPKVLSPEYDPRFLPGPQKTGATLGMGMTEKQGGSDVRSNTTFAEPAGRDAWG
ncbi:MAG: DNA alkylation response protein, partial [Betaproteobacteria bacterium]|nr:DNA alkylation response protein [Betaproteobacteria bacterium]